MGNSATGPLAKWVPFLLSVSLGRYEMSRFIGEGGFALVFEARHADTGRYVAIKVLPPLAPHDSAQDFENEGQLLKKLAGCSRVIEHVESGHEELQVNAGAFAMPVRVPFHVLALAKEALSDHTEDQAARDEMSWHDRLRFWRDLLIAIRQMHGAEVAHRDLKAENCLLFVRGAVTSVRVADFGRGKDLSLPPAADARAYISGRGDRRFAPPEYLLLQGDSTAENFVTADYYGLGSLMVEMISGHPMTALALGNFAAVMRTEQQNISLGVRTSPASLQNLYTSAIEDVTSSVPALVKEDLRTILYKLCDPRPSERRGGSPYRRDRASTVPLEWVLRRIDIMVKRLEIQNRQVRRNLKDKVTT